MARIRIIGLVTGAPSGAAGQWVKSYTPHGRGGRGDIELTPNRSDAKVYETVVAALEDWQRVSVTHPTRPDGQPNRPMTAWTVRIEPED